MSYILSFPSQQYGKFAFRILFDGSIRQLTFRVTRGNRESARPKER
jgi:hypothetical protein